MKPDQTRPNVKTIKEIIDRKLWLRVSCTGCERVTEIPFGLLPDLVPVHISIEAAATIFTCMTCGARGAKAIAVDALDNW